MDDDFVRPPEAPVFEPTPEEFRDPFAYLEKIRSVAEATGICKIRPPPSWQPPFAVDVDNFRFTPRVQKLNELEAKTRVKLSFLDHLAKFWELQGISLKIPMIEKKYLDLYTLHKVVQEEGGFDMVTTDRSWSKVAAKLGYQQNLSAVIETNYEKILYPYDIFVAGASVDSKDLNVAGTNDDNSDDDDDDVVFVKLEPSSSSTVTDIKPDIKPDVKPQVSSSCHAADVGDEQKDDFKVPLEAKDGKKLPFNKELRRLSFIGAGPKMVLPDVEAIVDGAFYDHSDSTLTRRRTRDKRSRSYLDGLLCRTCGAGSAAEPLLVCDGCSDAYHNSCLIFPLKDIPRKAWRCSSCIAKVCRRPSMAYGFEQASREYSLQSFGEMADKFKIDYFGAPIHTVSCAAVEREFWRLVNCIEEDVVVEYGADNPVGDLFGSGFPTEKTRDQFPDDDEYISSGWNLNNMPVWKKSLLRYISADISGMKVPWCYVGMCFSCFAWHTEDHWTYSINYMHWGEPKTWYGVPGSKAELLEDVMRKYAPELFEQAPDLLHQLTTTMNPTMLMAAGVPVVRTDQHAGEIVITCPRSYHAGFNQGYNFAEAVNFTLADWLPLGRACVKEYQLMRRQCVFSHDELVCKMAHLPAGTLDPNEISMVYHDMLTMVENEKKLRRQLLDKGTMDAEREAFELLPDDERQCDVCKTTCFLSAVTCECCDGKLVCILHADDLCQCPMSQRCLRYRYTLNELLEPLKRLKDFMDGFNNWSSRASSLIAMSCGDKKSDVLEVKALIDEAEKKYYTDCAAYKSLVECLDVIMKCKSLVEKLAKTGNADIGKDDDTKLNIDQLKDLCSKVTNLCCVVDEEPAIKDILCKVEQLQLQIKETVAAEQLDSSTLKTLFTSELLTHFSLPEHTDLKKAVKQIEWLEAADNVLSPSDVVPAFNDVRRLIESGVKLGRMHPSCASAMTRLRQLFAAASECEIKASRSLTTRPYQDISSLETIVAESASFTLRLPSVAKISESIQKAKEWTQDADKLLNSNQPLWLEDISCLVDRGRQVQVLLDHLPKFEARLFAARDWTEKLKRIFLLKKAFPCLVELLLPRTDLGNLTEERLKKDISVPCKIEIEQVKEDERNELSAMLELRARNQNKSEKNVGVYCFCQNERSGTMMQCQLCSDLFHVRCVVAGGSKKKVTAELTQKPFFCSRCRRTRRPPHRDVVQLLTELKKYDVFVLEGVALQCLSDRVAHWLERLQTAFAVDEVAAVVKTIQNNRDKKSGFGDCVENMPPLIGSDCMTDIGEHVPLSSTLSKKTLDGLEVLMVEGDLLEVEMEEKDLLRSILASCCPEKYGVLTFVFPTSEKEKKLCGQTKRKKSLDSNITMKILKNDSCTVARAHVINDVVIINDDDDDEDEDDVGICAAAVCIKPVGDEIIWIQCDKCNQCFHFQCVGLSSSDIYYRFLCEQCQAPEDKPSNCGDGMHTSAVQNGVLSPQKQNQVIHEDVEPDDGHSDDDSSDEFCSMKYGVENGFCKPRDIVNIDSDDDVILIE